MISPGFSLYRRRRWTILPIRARRFLRVRSLLQKTDCQTLNDGVDRSEEPIPHSRRAVTTVGSPVTRRRRIPEYGGFRLRRTAGRGVQSLTASRGPVRTIDLPLVGDRVPCDRVRPERSARAFDLRSPWGTRRIVGRAVPSGRRGSVARVAVGSLGPRGVFRSQRGPPPDRGDGCRQVGRSVVGRSAG